MQLEGVRISWASKYKVNTGCESCQWVGKGAVQASPRRGLARGVPNGTIMGENRRKTKWPIKVQNQKPGKADTLGKHTQKQKTSICIFQGDLFGHLRDAHPIPSYQWRPKFGHGRKMNPSHANGFRGSDVLQARLNRAIKQTKKTFFIPGGIPPPFARRLIFIIERSIAGFPQGWRGRDRRKNVRKVLLGNLHRSVQFLDNIHPKVHEVILLNLHWTKTAR